MKYFMFFNILILISCTSAQVPADTTTPFTIAPNILPLRDWKKFSFQKLNVGYPDTKLSMKDFYSPPVISDNPFFIDMRENSFYTPRFVTDELNLIMNRPRDNAFVPILGVAYLAWQLAQKHLLISEKTAITPLDILQVPEGLPVLGLLWDHSPQKTEELYKDSTLSTNYTMMTLEDLLSKMGDNKLVRQKTIDNDQTVYYPALNRDNYADLLERGAADSTLSQNQKTIIHALKASPLLLDINLVPEKKKN